MSWLEPLAACAMCDRVRLCPRPWDIGPITGKSTSYHAVQSVQQVQYHSITGGVLPLEQSVTPIAAVAKIFDSLGLCLSLITRCSTVCWGAEGLQAHPTIVRYTSYLCNEVNRQFRFGVVSTHQRSQFCSSITGIVGMLCQWRLDIP